MESSRPISPEWLTPARADFGLDDALKGGWGVSPAPVLRGASFTDFGTHEIAVPMDDSPEARAIQFHELLHTRFSPTTVPTELMSILGLSKQAVRVAEEVRINLLGVHLAASLPGHRDVISNLADGTERATADKAVETKNWNDALSLFLSCLNTNAFRMVKRRLRRNPEWRDPLTVIEQTLGATSWIADKDPYSRGFYRVGGRAETQPIEYKYRDRFGKEATQFLPEGFVYHTMPLAEVIEGWMNTPPKSVGRNVRGLRHNREIKGRGNRWETMRFGSVCLTESTASFISRRKRPAMTGKYPSRPDRLLTDPERRIFRESVRGRGGIVIFDCSGSMGVDHDVVRHAVAQFAGATVVVYSHSSPNRPNAWVVAHNGRMISADDFAELPLNCGNGIDGEVLRWAVRNRKNNKEFIVWVSDGAVTGRNDRTSEDLLGEVSLLSAKNNIIGVDTCDEALELLADMKRGRTPRNKYCRNVDRCLTQMYKYGKRER